MSMSELEGFRPAHDYSDFQVYLTQGGRLERLCRKILLTAYFQQFHTYAQNSSTVPPSRFFIYQAVGLSVLAHRLSSLTSEDSLKWWFIQENLVNELIGIEDCIAAAFEGFHTAEGVAWNSVQPSTGFSVRSSYRSVFGKRTYFDDDSVMSLAFSGWYLDRSDRRDFLVTLTKAGGGILGQVVAKDFSLLGVRASGKVEFRFPHRLFFPDRPDFVSSATFNDSRLPEQFRRFIREHLFLARMPFALSPAQFFENAQKELPG